MTRDKRFAFIQAGSFSTSNENLLKALKKEFQSYKIDVIDLWADDVIERRDIINLFYIIKEYGTELITRRKKPYECVTRTTYFFKTVRERMVDRLKKQNYAFTFQTQSLFDASVPGVPHFVYTDHTHLNNLSYPFFDEKKLFNESWIALEKTIYHNATLNFTMSSNVRDSIIEQYSCPPEKVKTVYCGSNTGIPPSSEIDDQKYSNMNILFVGVDWERKGGPQLLEAFKALSKVYPKAQLTIVGCSPEIEIRNCNVVGRVPLSEVNRYYENASVFCLPTRIEPFGIVFLEAFFHKLPVVSTKIGALPEIVSDGETGYLVDDNDVHQLSEKLKLLISDPDRCKTFGDRGYHSVKERYTWEKTAWRMKEQINSFLDEN